MNKQQLASRIWESANKMRSKIEANEYRDYILGFIFYKFLSETEVARLKARDFAEEDLPSLVEDDKETVDFVKGECGYFIAYENLFSTWVGKGAILIFRTCAMLFRPLAATSTQRASVFSTVSLKRCRRAFPSSEPTRVASQKPLAISSTSSRISRWMAAKTMTCWASSTSI